MNPVDTSQHFKRDRVGWFSSASQRLICALKMVLARSSRSRRRRGAAAGLTELLEVRQVLSTTNTMQPVPLESGEALPAASDEKVSFNKDFPADLPTQLTEFKPNAGLNPENEPGLSAADPAASVSWDGRISSGIPSTADPASGSTPISWSDTEGLNSEESASLSPAEKLNPSTETSLIGGISTSLIDGVFSISVEIPYGASLLPMKPADVGSSAVPQPDSRPESLFRHDHDHAQAAADMLAAPSLDVSQANAAAVDHEQGRDRTVLRNDGRERRSRILRDSRISNRPGSSTLQPWNNSDTDNLGSVILVSASPDTIGSAAHWLAWLSGSDAEGESTAHQVVPQTIRVIQVLPASDSSQKLRSQSGSASDVKPASASVPQTQSRRLRESHRQSSSSGRLEWISRDEFEPPEMFRRDHRLVQLRYVANPRGPPTWRPDANILLVDPEAAADLLERLRYSITPRGPSLVTAQMQSSEFPSFSGPGVSPEELSFKLAC